MRTFILILSIVVFIFSMFQIVQYFLDAKGVQDLYNDLAEIYYGDIKEPKDGQNQGDTQEGKDATTHRNRERLESLRAINPDIIGWITIPQTRIDYPIVKGSDNQYYLTHDIKGNENRHGSIFLDYRNDPLEDENWVIHGHHMKDGTMFKDLVKFKKDDFFQDNRLIRLDLEGETIEFEIFSVYIINADSLDIKLSFNDATEYEEYFLGVKEKSLYPSDVGFSKDKTMLTLSTCTYEEKDARLVLHCVSRD